MLPSPRANYRALRKTQPHKGVRAPEDCNCGGQEGLRGRSQFKKGTTANKSVRSTPLGPLWSEAGKASRSRSVGHRMNLTVAEGSAGTGATQDTAGRAFSRLKQV